MKRKIVIYSRFNDNDLNLIKRFNTEPLSREWIENRMKIFNQYTRVSLENQTNQNFLAVLRVHPSTYELIEEVAKKYPPLKSNIKFTSDYKKTITEYIGDGEEFYMANIDSDDMYHPELVQTLYEVHPKKETAVLICQKGYILEHDTGMIAHYRNKSPSVFTQIFKVKDYLEIYKHYPDLSHVIMSTIPYETFRENMFIIVAHDNNTYTKAKPYYKYSVTEEEKEIIKKQFKLSY